MASTDLWVRLMIRVGLNSGLRLVLMLWLG
jgi:hypothetical protein